MNKKKQSKPVNKEAFRMLAVEIGLNAASRKLGVPIPTGKSWAQRGGWKLPKRKGGGKPLELVASSPHPVADALDATHKELEAETKTALMQTLHKAAQAVAKKDPLDISNMGQFRDACLSAARMFGWDGSAQPSVTYYGDDNRTVVLCDAERRQQLIEQRQRLLEQEATLASSREVEAAASETQSGTANAGTGNGIVAQDPSPVVQPDPVYKHMAAIGRAETWKTGKGSEAS
jgi:hypothetical protein